MIKLCYTIYIRLGVNLAHNKIFRVLVDEDGINDNANYTTLTNFRTKYLSRVVQSLQ